MGGNVLQGGKTWGIHWIEKNLGAEEHEQPGHAGSQGLL